ncbi:MAG: TAXI family TRAP transporter solute-binding subunit [Actinomycetes bacterium]
MAGPARRAGAALAGLLLLVAASPGCGSDDEPSGRLRIAAGSAGGIYLAYAHALADVTKREMPGVRPSVLSTSASIENLRLLTDGQAEVAFSLADSAAEAVEGDTPFGRPQPVRALARLYDNYVHLVVPTDSPIRTLADLRGREVSVGPDGSGTELTAARLLTVAGLTQDTRTTRLGLIDSAEALRTGDVDAFFWSGGLPTPEVTELSQGSGVRLVPLVEMTQQMRNRYGDFYSEATVPASAYGLGESVPTIAVPNYLVVQRSMDDELAYRLTRLLFEQQAALARAHAAGRQLYLRSAISTYPVPLHPGARRYYRQTAG